MKKIKIKNGSDINVSQSSKKDKAIGFSKDLLYQDDILDKDDISECYKSEYNPQLPLADILKIIDEEPEFPGKIPDKLKELIGSILKIDLTTLPQEIPFLQVGDELRD